MIKVVLKTKTLTPCLVLRTRVQIPSSRDFRLLGVRIVKFNVVLSLFLYLGCPLSWLNKPS